MHVSAYVAHGEWEAEGQAKHEDLLAGRLPEKEVHRDQMARREQLEQKLNCHSTRLKGLEVDYSVQKVSQRLRGAETEYLVKSLATECSVWQVCLWL